MPTNDDIVIQLDILLKCSPRLRSATPSIPLAQSVCHHPPICIKSVKPVSNALFIFSNVRLQAIRPISSSSCASLKTLLVVGTSSSNTFAVILVLAKLPEHYRYSTVHRWHGQDRVARRRQWHRSMGCSNFGHRPVAGRPVSSCTTTC